MQNKIKVRAQGTIEYLIIIAIVVVIALVVVSILTGFLGEGDNTSINSKQIQTLSGELSISEMSLTTDGNFILNIKNNSEIKTIKNIEIIDQNDQEFDYSLFQSQQQNFLIYSNQTCAEGTIFSSNIKITYTTKHGLNKFYYLEDIPFECANVTPKTIANSNNNSPNQIMLNNYTWYFTNDSNYVFNDSNCSIVDGKLRLNYITNQEYLGQTTNQTSANYFLSKYIKQNDNNYWTPTGELDWNKEAVNTTTSGGWGELVSDFNIKPENLVGLWHLNGNANDSSGSGNNGTWVGSEDYSIGLWGTNGAYFNELSYVDTGTTNYCFNNGSNFTVNFWGNFETFNDNPVFFSTGDYQVSGWYVRSANTSGNLQMLISQSGGRQFVQTNETVPLNEWVMITFQRDGSNGHIYVNGEEFTYSTNMSLLNPASCSSNATLGAGVTSAREVDGTMEEVAIWNTALSSEEVKTLYKQQKSQWLDTNLVAYYKFNELSNGKVVDLARGYNGTLVGTANINGKGLWDSTALDLDGDSDYVTIGDDEVFDLTSDFTICAWFKRNDIVGTEGIIGKWWDGITRGWMLNTNVDSGNLWVNLTFRSPGDGIDTTIRNSDTYDYSATSWHHTCAKYDGTNYTIYVDGYSSNGAITAGEINTNNAIFTIGESVHTTINPYNSFNGLIDEVKIYDRALEDWEIVQDYNRFLEAKFVSNEIIDSGLNDNDWDQIKINSDSNFIFGKEICGVNDSGCEPDKFNDGLVGLWHLNENTNDSSGNGNDGTFINNNYTNGLWDTQAGQFNGSNDFVDLPINPVYESNSKGSISAWVKTNDLGGAIFSYGSSNTTDNWVLLNYVSTGQFRFHIRDGSTNDDYYKTTNKIFEDNVWQHVVVVNDGTWLIYVNGNLENTTIFSDNGGGADGDWFEDIAPQAALPAIGYLRRGTSSSTYFNGQIEEVAIWNKTLSEDEVKDLYKKGVSRMDLNVYSCSDASCETKTGSEYFTDVNNGTWFDLSSNIENSRYLGFDFNFYNAQGFDNNTNYFVNYGAYFKDINLISTSNVYNKSCTVDVNFSNNELSSFTWNNVFSDNNSLGSGTIDYNLMFDNNAQWFNYSNLPITSDYNAKIKVIIKDGNEKTYLDDLTISYTN